MSIDNDIALLSRADLFAGFGRDEMRLLAFGAEAHVVRAGHHLAKSGETGDAGHVLVTGVMVVCETSGALISRHSAPGTLFGDIQLVSPAPWPADIIAETDSTLLRLPSRMFRKVIEENPEAARLVLERMAQRLSDDLALIKRHSDRLV